MKREVKSEGWCVMILRRGTALFVQMSCPHELHQREIDSQVGQSCLLYQAVNITIQIPKALELTRKAGLSPVVLLGNRGSWTRYRSLSSQVGAIRALTSLEVQVSNIVYSILSRATSYSAACTVSIQKDWLVKAHGIGLEAVRIERDILSVLQLIADVYLLFIS